jgi:hypothetical protein
MANLSGTRRRGVSQSDASHRPPPGECQVPVPVFRCGSGTCVPPWRGFQAALVREGHRSCRPAPVTCRGLGASHGGGCRPRAISCRCCGPTELTWLSRSSGWTCAANSSTEPSSGTSANSNASSSTTSITTTPTGHTARSTRDHLDQPAQTRQRGPLHRRSESSEPHAATDSSPNTETPPDQPRPSVRHPRDRLRSLVRRQGLNDDTRVSRCPRTAAGQCRARPGWSLTPRRFSIGHPQLPPTAGRARFVSRLRDLGYVRR